MTNANHKNEMLADMEAHYRDLLKMGLKTEADEQFIKIQMFLYRMNGGK